MSIEEQLKQYTYHKDGNEYYIKVTDLGMVFLKTGARTNVTELNTGSTTAMKRIDFLHDKLRRNGWTITKK